MDFSSGGAIGASWGPFACSPFQLAPLFSRLSFWSKGRGGGLQKSALGVAERRLTLVVLNVKFS